MRLPVTRCIASPRGDIPYTAANAARPLEGGGPQPTYAAYFEALEAFVAGEGYGPLRAALAASGDRPGIEAATGLVVRAQKHGALYHPASLDVVWPDGVVRYCVNVAATPLALDCLETEAGLLAALRARFTPDFLPRPHAVGRAQGLGFLLEDWFDGFHEFHQDGRGRVRLWDFEAGERVLGEDEALALYREAARILTRYFDPATGAAIGPWSHAAGDFVARAASGGIEVRLVTVRGYGADRDFAAAGAMAGRLAGLAFFTALTMRLRLDRVDGVGALVLAGEDVAEAAAAGFAAGLLERDDTRELAPGLLDFLGSFSPGELAGAASQLAEPAPPEETALVGAAWPGHAAAVLRALAAVREA